MCRAPVGEGAKRRRGVTGWIVRYRPPPGAERPAPAALVLARLELHGTDVGSVAARRVGDAGAVHLARPAALVQGQAVGDSRVDHGTQGGGLLRLGRAAVVLQRAELRILAEDVIPGVVHGRGIGVLDQAEPGDERAAGAAPLAEVVWVVV